AKWSSPTTNKLLLEAGAYHYFHDQRVIRSPVSALQDYVPVPTDVKAWPTQEINTGKWLAGSVINAGFTPSRLIPSWWGVNGALSYVTGSHNLKLGFTHVQGLYITSFPPVPPVLRLLNGVPFQVMLNAKP